MSQVTWVEPRHPMIQKSRTRALSLAWVLHPISEPSHCPTVPEAAWGWLWRRTPQVDLGQAFPRHGGPRAAGSSPGAFMGQPRAKSAAKNQPLQVPTEGALEGVLRPAGRTPELSSPARTERAVPARDRVMWAQVWAGWKGSGTLGAGPSSVWLSNFQTVFFPSKPSTIWPSWTNGVGSAVPTRPV